MLRSWRVGSFYVRKRVAGDKDDLGRFLYDAN